jgi:transcriptional regulator with XRE-family HTH domain
MSKVSSDPPADPSTPLIVLLTRLRQHWGIDGDRERSKFARRIGFNSSTVFRWEHGGPITKAAIERLARCVQETPTRIQAYLNGEIALDELHLFGEIEPTHYEQIKKLLPELKVTELLDLLLEIYNLLRRQWVKGSSVQLLEQSEAATYNSVAEIVQQHWETLLQFPRLQQRLPALRDGDQPTEMDLSRIAVALDIDERYLEELANLPKQTNGTP